MLFYILGSIYQDVGKLSGNIDVGEPIIWTMGLKRYFNKFRLLVQKGSNQSLISVGKVFSQMCELDHRSRELIFQFCIYHKGYCGFEKNFTRFETR